MRGVLLLALLLWGCSKGAQADLPSISEARSLAAEWAMVNDQAAQGRLTTAYTATMRQELHQQIEAAAKSLSQPDSGYGEEIQALLRQPADTPPQQLKAHAARLKQIENQLESD